MRRTIGLFAIAAATMAPAAARAAETPVEHARAIDRAADPAGAAAAWRAALPGLAGVARGRALTQLGAALVAASDSKTALPVLEEARALLLPPEASYRDLAELLAATGSALADLNRLDEADRTLDAALAAWRTAAPGGSDEEADTLMGKATVAFARGDLATARTLGEQALAISERLPSPSPAAQVGLLSNMSTIHLQARELEASERYARRAMDGAAKALPTDHPVTIVALTNWVAVLAAQNRRAESVAILGRIAEIRERRFGRDYPPLAITYNNLSRNLMFLKQPAQAEPYARRAVEIAERTLDPADQGLASIRDNLADILDDLGNTVEAVRIRRQAIAGLGPAGNEARLMRIRRSLAASLVQNGDPAAALPEFAAVGEWLAKSRPPENPDRIDNEASLAVIEARIAAPGAHERLIRTVDLVERGLFAGGDASRRVSPLGPMLEHLLEAAWLTRDRATGFRVAQLQALDEAGRAVAQAVARRSAGGGEGATLIRQRQDLLDERDRQSAAALRQYGKDPDAYRTATAAVGRIDGELGATERALARVVPAFAALARFTPLTEREVAGRLRPGEALVMPAVLGKGAVTFVLHDGRADWGRSPAGTDLPTAIAALRLTLGGGEGTRGAGASTPFAFDAKRAHALYRAIVPAALDPALKGATTWLLAPGGAFTAIPFAVLVTDPAAPGAAAPAWLIRKVALATLPALSELGAASAASSGPRRFVGVGAPVLNGSAGPATARGALRNGIADRAALLGLAPLPQAERELRRMSAALPTLTPVLLTGPAATETAFKATSLRDVGVLAFATHGLLGDGAGAEPGLVLTPPAAPTAADDGVLSSSEIAALDLDVDWVVLSACDTGGGSSPGAPALSGLARAFLYAGARSLLVSHWAVRDDVAARLTVDTVARTTRGESRPQALRHAVLSLMADHRVEGAADPSVWAPFFLVER